MGQSEAILGAFERVSSDLVYRISPNLFLPSLLAHALRLCPSAAVVKRALSVALQYSQVFADSYAPLAKELLHRADRVLLTYQLGSKVRALAQALDWDHDAQVRRDENPAEQHILYLARFICCFESIDENRSGLWSRCSSRSGCKKWSHTTANR